MENSSLGKLPPELRNHLYAAVLKHHSPIDIYLPNSRNGWTLFSPQITKHTLVLTQACNEINKESSELFYSLNDFTIHCLVYTLEGAKLPLRRFCGRIGKENTKALRSVTVEMNVQRWHHEDMATVDWPRKTAILITEVQKTLRDLSIYDISTIRILLPFEYGAQNVEIKMSSLESSLRERMDLAWAKIDRLPHPMMLPDELYEIGVVSMCDQLLVKNVPGYVSGRPSVTIDDGSENDSEEGFEDESGDDLEVDSDDDSEDDDEDESDGDAEEDAEEQRASGDGPSL